MHEIRKLLAAQNSGVGAFATIRLAVMAAMADMPPHRRSLLNKGVFSSGPG